MLITWSKAAQRHLSDIHAYIAKDSRRYANNVVGSIRQATRRLRKFPESGALVPEFGFDDTREVRWGNYRIFYAVRNKTVVISAVVHSARDITRAEVE